MIQSKNKKSGFTIVELLIVIVVVGILAAITIVAYNGIQERAQNTARIEAARKMHALMRNYVITNGADAFKANVAFGGSCVGEGYEDVNPGAGVGCVWFVNNSTGATSAVASSTGLDTIMKAQGNNTVSYPRIEYTIAAGVGSYIQSAPYLSYNVNSNTVDGVAGVVGQILYQLKGENQDCVLRPMIHAVSSGVFTISDGVKNSNVNIGNDAYAGSGSTNCRLYFHPDAIK